MGQAIRKIPIIRQKKQSLCVPVKTAHRKQTRHPLGKQIDHGRAVFRIIKRRDALRRLVKQYVISLFIIKHGLVIDFDAAFARNHQRPHLRYHATADFYPALCHQFLGVTAARHASKAQKLLNSDGTLRRLIHFRHSIPSKSENKIHYEISRTPMHG